MKRRRPADDDARLWQDVARTVTPLARREGAAPPAAPGPAKGSPKGAAAETGAGSSSAAAADPPSRRAPVDLAGLKIGAQDRPAGAPPAPAAGRDRLGEGAAPGVDGRSALRFRRGLMPIDGRLDLHGHTRQSGRRALAGFLRAQRAAGARCVLVVTGKGLKGDWSPGALRQALPEWLNAPDLRRLILAFCQAQPRHGGSGATYILLKRQRGKGDGD